MDKKSFYIENILRYLFISIRFIFILAAFTVIGFFVFFAFKYAFPFIIALIFSVLLNPLVNLLENKGRLPRGFAVTIVLLIFFAIIGGLMTLLVSEIITGINYLITVVPDQAGMLVKAVQNYFLKEIMPLWERLTHLYNSLQDPQKQTVENNIQQLSQKATAILSHFGTNVLNFLTNTLTRLPYLLTVGIFILLATFFILKDWYRMGAFLERNLPGAMAGNLKNIQLDLQKAFTGWIRAQFTLISITGVIVLIGLLILRIEHPVTIALITAFVDLLPYLGTGTVFVPWILYNFIAGNYFLTIGLAILYAIVVIQRQMMEPKILSSSIGLEPLPTLIALFVGFKLFGFIGLIVGPVTLVILNTLIKARVFRGLWSYVTGKGTFLK